MDQCKFKQQLTLNLLLKDYATFSNFVIGDNANIVKILIDFRLNSGGEILYLYGGSGSGKSHLLNAMCQDFDTHAKKPIYFSFEDGIKYSPTIIDNFSCFDLICLDDVDLICGNLPWEEQLFHCLNQVVIKKKKIVFTAKTTPQLLPLALPDLKSRLLGGGLIFGLKQLDDEGKRLALKLRAEFRGLKLDDSGINFLMNRYNRHSKSLFALLSTLDKASLIAKKKLTIPFIKQVLDQVLDDVI